MLFFDIGANIGRWALANMRNDVRIISVEASPTTFQSLCRAVGGHANIVPLHYAVTSASATSVTFYHCNAANVLSTLDREWLSSPESRFGSMAGSVSECTVPAISLDKLIEIHGVPDLLKIDVEGAENIVLRSLTQIVPMICFEWASEWRDKNIECVEYLRGLGFTRFALQHEDNYTYRPAVFDKTADEIADMLTKSVPKRDWGMIWAIPH
jgi:FkbM family methyltransferase